MCASSQHIILISQGHKVKHEKYLCHTYIPAFKGEHQGLVILKELSWFCKH